MRTNEFTMENLLDELVKLFDNPPYSNKVEVCVWYHADDEIAFSSIDKDQTIGWLFERHVFGYDVEEVTYSDKTHGHPLVFVTLTKQWQGRKRWQDPCNGKTLAMARPFGRRLMLKKNIEQSQQFFKGTDISSSWTKNADEETKLHN